MNEHHSRTPESVRFPAAVTSRGFGVIPLDFLEKGEVHPCPYLLGRVACEEAFVARVFPSALYKDFMDHGFRRAGFVFYRPACQLCAECRPLRVPVAGFTPTKSQRRVFRRNTDLHVTWDTPRYSRDKYRMYCDYLVAQHNSIQPDGPDEFSRFLYSSPLETVEFEYRLHGRLVAVGLSDVANTYLSSVYVFFDPEFSSRSLGTYSVIHEMRICAERAIPHYYLGYYVAGSPAMCYKARFGPYEILNVEGEWARPAGTRVGSVCSAH